MAAPTRSSLVIAPAKLAFAGASFWHQAPFKIKLEPEMAEMTNEAIGKYDERVKDFLPGCDVQPDGRWTQAIIDAIWGFYANLGVGASIFTDTDRPLVCTSSADTHTLVAAAITKLPDIILSADPSKRIIGSMTFAGTKGKTKVPTDADAYYTIGAGGSIADSTFAPAQVISQPYTGVFGAVTGFTEIYTEEGWTISFDLKTAPKPIDNFGTIDMRFQSIAVMAKCRPIGPTAAQILSESKVQGSGAGRGRSLASSKHTLTITGADTVNYFTASCALKGGGFEFGNMALRNDEVGFVAVRDFSSGAPTALYTLAAAA